MIYLSVLDEIKHIQVVVAWNLQALGVSRNQLGFQSECESISKEYLKLFKFQGIGA